MAKATKRHPFDVQVFLSTVDRGRSVSNYRKGQKVFSQGDPGDTVFYIQKGKVKVCVVSEQGKEAVVALHGEGDFFGESCLTGHPLRRGDGGDDDGMRHHANREGSHRSRAPR